MKEFMQTVKQTFQAGRQEIIGYNASSIFAGIVGTIITFVLIKTDATGETYATIGAFMAMMIGGMMIVIVGIFSMQQDFNLAISMGKTRKYYAPARYLLSVASCFICICITLVFAWIEELMCASLYPEAVCEMSLISLVKHPAITVGAMLFVPMIVMLFGALFLRFGMKAFWFFWVLWMLLCFTLPKMVAQRKDPDSVLGKMWNGIADFIRGISDMQIVLGLMVLLLAGLIVAFMLLRKQRVTL